MYFFIINSRPGDLAKEINKGKLPLTDAVRSERRDLVRWWLELHGDKVDKDGKSALHVAAATRIVDICSNLVNNKASVNKLMVGLGGRRLLPPFCPSAAAAARCPSALLRRRRPLAALLPFCSGRRSLPFCGGRRLLPFCPFAAAAARFPSVCLRTTPPAARLVHVSSAGGQASSWRRVSKSFACHPSVISELSSGRPQVICEGGW